MSESSSTLRDIHLDNEELIAPPKVDFVGIGMMMIVAIVVGFISSLGVILSIFISVWTFAFWNWISPILLAMITFFSLTISNMIYIWSGKGIFPHIYTWSRTTFLHASIFSIILYIIIAPLYLVVDSINLNSSGILIAYIVHILLNILGIEIIISILSNYRYALLSIYSSIISFVVTGSLLFFIYSMNNTDSNNALFILLTLSMLVFTINIFINFLIRFLYYRYYVISGSDPIGDVFSRIEQETKDMETETEQKLFLKK